MKLGIIFSLAFALFNVINYAPTAAIQGQVIEESTGDPVLFGTVALYKDGVLLTGTDTDLDGNYVFNNLAAGTYEVEVSYMGLKTQRISDVVVKDKERKLLNFSLKDEGVLLEEVQVVGYKVPLVEFDNTTSGSIVYSSDIKALPSKNIRNIAAQSAGANKKKKRVRRKDRKKRLQSGDISIREARANLAANKTRDIKVTPEQAAKMMPVPTSKSQIAEINKESISAEKFEKPEENQFISPLTESVSTFSLDVDRASYSNVRRFINSGNMPPKDAVRVEEMINYFHYDYADPQDKHPIAMSSEYTSCPWNSDHQLLHLAVKAKELKTEKIPASNLVFLLDVSGSMRSQNKLPLVKESFKLLLDKLRPEDRVAIVTYAGSSGVPLKSTSAANKMKILQSLSNLRSGGGTAGAQGIITAYEIAQKNFIEGGNNRVILATDGDFNIGIHDTQALEKLISEKKETGVFLSVLGFGMGNYQDHKMQTLANKGNGNHGYIDNLAEAKKVFVNEFESTLFTVAKDVKLQIEFNPAYVQSYRLVGYENRMLAKEDFNDDTKDAGEVGAGHRVTAIYEIIPTKVESEFAAEVSNDLLNGKASKQASANGQLGYLKCRYKHPDKKKSIKFNVKVSSEITPLEELENDRQFSIAVAEFGLSLAESKYLKQSNLNNIIALANKNKGKDTYGFREECIQLMKRVQSLGLIAKS